MEGLQASASIGIAELVLRVKREQPTHNKEPRKTLVVQEVRVGDGIVLSHCKSHSVASLALLICQTLAAVIVASNAQPKQPDELGDCSNKRLQTPLLMGSLYLVSRDGMK
jgi:hypothetical protein